ncbi:hypothetical protein N9X12_00365 [Alphaproteobacteria bacterium]|nr:hypothetical protein [Alphaproteobacteria bacterium]
MKHKLTFTSYGIVVTGLLIALASCKDMSRFKQETFSCGLNETGIIEVVVRSIKLGDDAIITSINAESRMAITQSSDSFITIADEQTKIVIDRQTKALTVSLNDNLYHLQCKSSIFKM